MKTNLSAEIAKKERLKKVALEEITELKSDYAILKNSYEDLQNIDVYKTKELAQLKKDYENLSKGYDDWHNKYCKLKEQQGNEQNGTCIKKCSEFPKCKPCGQILVRQILKHFNKKIRIDFGGKDAFSGREFGDYFIVGLDVNNDNFIKVNLKATETGVAMWYNWNSAFEFIND